MRQELVPDGLVMDTFGKEHRRQEGTLATEPGCAGNHFVDLLQVCLEDVGGEMLDKLLCKSVVFAALLHRRRVAVALKQTIQAMVPPFAGFDPRYQFALAGIFRKMLIRHGLLDNLDEEVSP